MDILKINLYVKSSSKGLSLNYVLLIPFPQQTGPRFPDPGSFEFEYGSKWKALYEMKKQKLQALDREMQLEEDKLVAQMEFAKYEHETEHLRAKLREREASRDQHKSQWEAREREMQEMLKLEQERRVRDEEAMSSRMQQQDANIRQRQQENTLLVQAQELNNLLDQQEADIQNRNQPGPAFVGNFGGGPSNAGLGSFNNRDGNFRGPQNDKPLMNAGSGPGFGGLSGPGFGGPSGPGFGGPSGQGFGGPSGQGFGGPSGPGFGGPGGMNNFNDGPGGRFPGNFGGPEGPGLFQSGPGGPGGPNNRMGPSRWDNNEDNSSIKRRRF